MAVSEGQQIKEHLRQVFREAGYGDRAEILLNDLEIFDSFHDFGNQSEFVKFKGICCSKILNKLAGARPNLGFLKSRRITEFYKGELKGDIGWDSSIENQIKRLYQCQVPEVLRLLPVGCRDAPAVTITIPQILANPALLITLQFSSVTITETDSQLTDEEKKIVGDAILKYMFGVPNRPQGVFFTNDASVSITRDLFIGFNNANDNGFFVGQLVTPQNVCDSATTSTNEGIYKDNAFTNDVFLIGEGSSKNRVRYVFNLEDNTSNFFSREFSVFELNKLEDKTFNAEAPYAFNYRIKLKNGEEEEDTGIQFHTDDSRKKGKDGPSVPYLKKLIDNRPSSATTSATIEQLLINILEMYGTDSEGNDKKNRILFDIKRSGDHEQANALWLFNNTPHNIHYGIFQTLDILSALYSRILGNPTILTYMSKSMQIYKGSAQMPTNPSDLNKFKLATLLGEVNRILGVYFSLFRVLDSSPISRLLTDLNQRANFVNNDPFKKICIKIKAADAVYSIQQIQNEIVYDLNNNSENIMREFTDNIRLIYTFFGQEINPEDVLEGFNIITPNFDEISDESVRGYILLLQDFLETNKESYELCEAYFQHFNNKKIIASANGIVTTLNIHEQFFVSSEGQLNGFVNKNDVMGFKKDQIKSDVLFNNKAGSKEAVSAFFTDFISSLMSSHMYLTTAPFTDLFNRLDGLHIPDKKRYRDNVIQNYCVPFLSEIERLIALQTGGAPSNNKNNNKKIFYDLLKNTVEVVKKLTTEKDAKKDFNIIVQSDITKYKLVEIYNEDNQKFTPITKEQQYKIISETLFKINAMIRKYSAVEYFTDQDINVMGGPYWITKTFIDVANVFIDMYLELELEKLDPVLENNLTNFYTYIFLPLSLKYKSMYNEEYEDFEVNLDAFSSLEILKMKLTLQVFGTRLPSGIDYDTDKTISIIKHIADNFKSLSSHNVNNKTTSIFGGRKKTQRRRSKGKTKSKISKVRRSTQYLKKKNK